jgi:hypothetical protein
MSVDGNPVHHFAEVGEAMLHKESGLRRMAADRPSTHDARLRAYPF